jgi:hypothetical protein
MIDQWLQKVWPFLHEFATCGFYVKEFLYSIWHAQKDLCIRANDRMSRTFTPPSAIPLSF